MAGKTPGANMAPPEAAASPSSSFSRLHHQAHEADDGILLEQPAANDPSFDAVTPGIGLEASSYFGGTAQSQRLPHNSTNPLRPAISNHPRDTGRVAFDLPDSHGASKNPPSYFSLSDPVISTDDQLRRDSTDPRFTAAMASGRLESLDEIRAANPDLSLSGNIISATFNIPHAFTYCKGGDWVRISTPKRTALTDNYRS